MNPLNIIKHIIGKPTHIKPIASNVCNENIDNGFAGGGLSNCNVLIISNRELDKGIIASVFDREGASFYFLILNTELSVDLIKKGSEDFIGPFTHIINLFFDAPGGELVSEMKSYNSEDNVYKIYQWHQQEVDYLVKNDQYSTICTVFLSGDSIDSKIKKKNVEMCIRGLAEVLANHGMICNGIIASENENLDNLLNYTVFLSSHYGQIMTGEVLFIDK